MNKYFDNQILPFSRELGKYTRTREIRVEHVKKEYNVPVTVQVFLRGTAYYYTSHQLREYRAMGLMV